MPQQRAQEKSSRMTAPVDGTAFDFNENTGFDNDGNWNGYEHSIQQHSVPTPAPSSSPMK